MCELMYQLRWALPIWLVGLLTNWWPDTRITQLLRGLPARRKGFVAVEQRRTIERRLNSR